MKKLLSKKCVDMSMGDLITFSCIFMIVIMAIYGGICWVVIKLDDILSAIEEFRDLISDRIHGYKGRRVDSEDEGAVKPLSFLYFHMKILHSL